MEPIDLDNLQISIIIPTLNEVDTIEHLITSILSLYRNAKCIVVDDGSCDGTQEVIKKICTNAERVTLIDRSEKRIKGLSASVWEGILQCTTPYFAVIDGDTQHPPEYLNRCFRNLGMGADISLGARESFGTKRRFFRIFTSTLAAYLSRFRLFFNGVTFCDPMSGFFGARTDFIKEIYKNNSSHMVPQGYKILFDILKVTPRDANLFVFYFPFGSRNHGESKFNMKVVYYFLLSLIK